MKDQKKLEKLQAKWRQAKAELNAAQAKESALRSEIDLLLASNKLLVAKITDGSEEFTFKRMDNYSVPKAAIADIRANVPEATFADVFTVSYKLKPAVYEKLTGKAKRAIKKHLTIKPAPLSVTAKQL